MFEILKVAAGVAFLILAFIIIVLNKFGIIPIVDIRSLIKWFVILTIVSFIVLSIVG